MVKKSGKLGVTLKGGAAESEFDKMRQKVTHKRIREQFIEEPDDEVWEEKAYKRELGDYKTNGLGHCKGTIEGITGILVPANKVWKVKRRRGTQALGLC